MKITRMSQIGNIQMDMRTIDFNDTQNAIDQLIIGVQQVVDAASRISEAGFSIDMAGLITEAISSGNTQKLESLKDEVNSFQQIQTRMVGSSLFGSRNENHVQKPIRKTIGTTTIT